MMHGLIFIYRKKTKETKETTVEVAAEKVAQTLTEDGVARQSIMADLKQQLNKMKEPTTSKRPSTIIDTLWVDYNSPSKLCVFNKLLLGVFLS